jgi:capsid protein
MTYDAAASDRLLTEWSGWWRGQMDAVEDWDREGLTIAQRAWKLALNDPYATALLDCVVGNVLGTGLQFVSNYQADTVPSTTAGELDISRRITDASRAHMQGFRLDPGGMLTSAEIIEQLVVSGFVAGDGFAIRGWSPKRPGCDGFGTVWRVLDASRVSNPKNKPNVDGALINGIELANGVPVRLHYQNHDRTSWSSVPWFDDDGTRNVIHYAPDRRRAGGVRGFSKFAPILRLATHLSRLAIAHVSGKRVQASHPMAIQSADPAKAAEAHRRQATYGPNSAIGDATVLFVSKDSTVTLPTFSYQGADYDQFVRTSLMAFCAAWGYPWQFVLHQLTEGNLATAQAALDQADKTTQRYQNGVIAAVCEPLNASTLDEAHARGTLGLPASVPLSAITAGTWDRPRRADANRLRTRQAAELGLSLGVSPSTTLAEMGYSYTDEVLRTKADQAYAAAHGVTLTLGPQAPQPAAPAPAPAPEPAEPDADDEPEDDQPTTNDDPSAMNQQQFLTLLTALRPAPAAPVQVITRMELDQESATRMGEAMGRSMPAAAAPVVNVPAPVVNVSAAPPTITVAASPANVTVQAADPAPIAVHVAAPQVTVDNRVVVPSRTVKAMPQGDGSVLMVPQG